MEALKLVTAPVNPAVELADLKTFLRIDTSADDDMLTAFIEAATKLVETWTGRRLITQTWAFYMDNFPGVLKFDALAPEGVTDGKLSEYIASKKYISIPLFPLQSVTHLKTYDDENTAFTMPSTDYFVDTAMEPGRLSLTNDSTWPTTFLRPIQGVEIQFVVGYGADSTDVPSTLRQAIMQIAAFYYNSRGCSDSIDSIPSGAKALLQAYRVYRI